MITQDFLLEYEIKLIKAFNRANRNRPLSNSSGGYLEAAKARDEFTREFGIAMRENADLLIKEIARGGYKPPEMFEKIVRDAETKLSNYLYQKDNRLDIVGFERLARDWKADVREVFYAKK